MKIQVKKNHYDFDKYVSIDRWNSYYYQILETKKLTGVHKILLVGIGDGIVVNILKNMNYDVTILDFDKRSKPDIVCSITDIDKVLKQKYDLIICCQVLEHIPFEYFDMTVEKISKCVTKNVIISLPYNRLKLFSANIFVPIIRKIPLKILIPKFWELNYKMEREGWGEHYYEVGIKNCSKHDIRNILSKYFVIKKEFNPIENLYHIFYILEVKK